MFLNDLKVSLQFLTILPSGKKEIRKEELERSIPYFPLAGLILGLLSYIVYMILSLLLPRDLCDILVLLFLVLLTGGLHMDGLSDTLDGMGFGKDRESSLKIMRDSRIGTFGAIGLVFAILIKYLALNNIQSFYVDNILLLMPLYGRWSVLVLGYQSQYAREGDGIGRVFVEKIKKEVYLKGILTAFIASLIIFQLRGLFIFTVLFFTVSFLKRYFEKRMGGITGDIFGAVIEFSEIAALLLTLIIQF